MEKEIKVIETRKMFERLGVLLLDGSGSMDQPHPSGISKAETINECMKDLITKLKNHRDAKSFILTVLTYDQDVEQTIMPTPVLDMDEKADYNPLKGHGGKTAIGDALEKGFEVAYDFVKTPSEIPRSAVILLMTDGINNAGRDPIEVSEEIHKKIKREELNNKIRRICALGFGFKNDPESLDTDTLKKIVTDMKSGHNTKKNFLIELDPNIIVDFFTRSIVS